MQLAVLDYYHVTLFEIVCIKDSQILQEKKQNVLTIKDNLIKKFILQDNYALFIYGMFLIFDFDFEYFENDYIQNTKLS